MAQKRKFYAEVLKQHFLTICRINKPIDLTMRQTTNDNSKTIVFRLHALADSKCRTPISPELCLLLLHRLGTIWQML